jgi:tetratricopeptide (TPR) repeat protein
MSQLVRTGCVSEEDIARFVEGHLAEPDARRVAEHVDACESCRELVALGVVAEPTSASGPLPRQFSEGDRLERFIVLGLVGKGGMGSVLAAYDPDLDRKVALKLVRPEATGNDLQLRLIREAQAMARLHHPEVITVYDVGTIDGQVFIAMEFVDGGTLRHWLQAEPRPMGEVIARFVRAGRGLAAAHAVGLVHRDFKADNVLVGRDGRQRVTDFGLARATGGDDTLAVGAVSPESPLNETITAAGVLLGTPAYMAPEQLDGAPVDGRADQFSFCVSLYQALYSELPFASDNARAIRAAIALDRVRPPPRGSTVPARVRAVLLRGLKSRPEDRYPTMEVLLDELTWEPVARRRWLQAGLAIVLVGLLALGAIVVRRAERQVCQGGARKLAGVWDATRQAAVRASFLATNISYGPTTFESATKALDRFTAAWRAMYVEACEATRLRGDQSEELLDLRMQCLDERRAALAALTDLFSHADAEVVEHARQAADNLGGVQQCADATALRAPIRPPTDATTRSRVDEVRNRLAAVQALKDAGKYDQALALMPELVTRARGMHYLPLEAEALELQGEVQELKSQPAADESYRQAQLAAETYRDDHMVAQALLGRLGVSAKITSKLELAHEYAKHAAAYLSRPGSDERQRWMLSAKTTTLLLAEGNLVEARPEAERSVELARRVYGDESPKLATALRQLGWVLGAVPDNSAAEAAIRRALAIDERVLGADHPLTSDTLMALGEQLRSADRDDEGLAEMRRALAIAEKAYGPDDPHVAHDLSQIADLLGGRGRPGDFAAALEAQQRAVAIARMHDPKGTELGYALAYLSGIYSNAHQNKKALDAVDEASSILVPLIGRKSPYLGWMVLFQRGRVLVQMGRYQEAIEPLEEALPLVTVQPPKALVTFSLAKALWGAGVTRQRARELAKQAQALAHAKDSRWPAADVLELDRWVAQHVSPALH